VLVHCGADLDSWITSPIPRDSGISSGTQPPANPDGYELFIVNPHSHVELARLVERHLPQPKPVRGQVGRHEPGPAGERRPVFTCWLARSRSVSRICVSVSMSFQTHNGAVA